MKQSLVTKVLCNNTDRQKTKYLEDLYLLMGATNSLDISKKQINKCCTYHFLFVYRIPVLFVFFNLSFMNNLGICNLHDQNSHLAPSAIK